MMGSGEGISDDQARDSAIAWLVRVQSDAATAEDWSALGLWLEASEAHRDAFDMVERLSVEIDNHASEILAGISRETADIVPFPQRSRPARTVASRRPAPTRFRALIAASLGAVAVAVGFGAWQTSLGPLEVYHTGVGETRTIALADGSHVHLDAASTMTARLGWFSREVTMGDAEATFDVAKNPNRPFNIAVGDQKIQVVGTEFNVLSYGGVVNVTLRRGVVHIYQPSLGQDPVTTLTPGWASLHKVGENGSSRVKVDPDDAFAWTQGRLICDHEPVSEILSYLNRRYQTPIRAPAAAGRSFSGVLELDDQKDVVRRMAAYLSLSAHDSAGQIVLE